MGGTGVKQHSQSLELLVTGSGMYTKIAVCMYSSKYQP